MLDRLTATQGQMFGMDGLMEWAVGRMLAKLAPEQRDRLREQWHAGDRASNNEE